MSTTNNETNKTNQGSDAPKASTTETQEVVGSSAELNSESASNAETSSQQGTAEAVSSTDTTATKSETKDDATKKEQLTVHARKRRKWLMQIGYEFEEATQLAKKYTFQALREMVIQETDGKSTVEKTPASKAANEKSGATEKTKKRVTPMVITHKDYPMKILEKDQADKLKQEILKKVLEHKDTKEMKPGFEESLFTTGYLRILASDQESRDWLVKTFHQLEFSDLKVISEKALMKIDVFVGDFPDSKDDSTEAILGFIESQNDGLQTTSWRVIDRKDKNNIVSLCFTVDPTSRKGLTTRENKLKFKFGQVHLTIKDKPNAAPKPAPKVAVSSKNSSDPSKTNLPSKSIQNKNLNRPSQSVNVWNVAKSGPQEPNRQNKPVVTAQGNRTSKPVHNSSVGNQRPTISKNNSNVVQNIGAQANRSSNSNTGNPRVALRGSNSNRNSGPQNDAPTRRNVGNQFNRDVSSSNRNPLNSGQNQPWATSVPNNSNNRNLSRNEEIIRFAQILNNSRQNAPWNDGVFGNQINSPDPPLRSRNVQQFDDSMEFNRGNRSNMGADDDFNNSGRSLRDSFDNRPNIRGNIGEFVSNIESRSNLRENDDFVVPNRNQFNLGSNSQWNDNNLRSSGGQQFSENSGWSRNTRFQDNFDGPSSLNRESRFQDNFDGPSNSNQNARFQDSFDGSNRTNRDSRFQDNFDSSNRTNRDSRFQDNFEGSNRESRFIDDFDGSSNFNRDQFNRNRSNLSRNDDVLDSFNVSNRNQYNISERNTAGSFRDSAMNRNDDFGDSLQNQINSGSNRSRFNDDRYDPIDAVSSSRDQFSGQSNFSRDEGNKSRSIPDSLNLADNFFKKLQRINELKKQASGRLSNSFGNSGSNTATGGVGSFNRPTPGAGGSGNRIGGSGNRSGGTNSGGAPNNRNIGAGFGGGGSGSGTSNSNRISGTGFGSASGGPINRTSGGPINRTSGGGGGAVSNNRNTSGGANKRPASGNMISYPIGLGQSGNVAKKFKNWD